MTADPEIATKNEKTLRQIALAVSRSASPMDRSLEGREQSLYPGGAGSVEVTSKI